MASVLSLTCSGFLPGYSALAQELPQKTARETLTIDLAEMTKPWTGDLDGMIKRRFIRVLTVYSKTLYFGDKGAQLQVLHRLSPGSGKPGCQEGRGRKNQGWSQIGSCLQ